MTDEEKSEEYVKEQILKHNRDVVLRPKNAVTYIDELKQAYLDGLAEGRKEKELSYKVGKVTKGELNKCKTIEEKMEWLGKVLGQAIFKNDMNYAVWVNVQKNNIIETLEKEIEEQKAIHENDKKKSISLIIEKGKELEKEISVLLSCSNCSENKGGYICEKEYNDKCLAQKIEYIKELKEENEKQKAEIEKLEEKYNESNELCNKQALKITEFEKENKELKAKSIIPYQEKGYIFNEDLHEIYFLANGELMIKASVVEEMKAQIEKMKSFIHSEIDFCIYCPLTNECENDEGTCPYAYVTEEEQKNLLMDYINKIRS